MRCGSQTLVACLFGIVLVGACSSDDSSGWATVPKKPDAGADADASLEGGGGNAGTSGKAGAAGLAGTAGQAGIAGTAGVAGAGGTAGKAGSAGQAGTAGSAGKAGSGGQPGDGGLQCEQGSSCTGTESCALRAKNDQCVLSCACDSNKLSCRHYCVGDVCTESAPCAPEDVGVKCTGIEYEPQFDTATEKWACLLACSCVADEKNSYTCAPGDCTGCPKQEPSSGDDCTGSMACSYGTGASLAVCVCQSKKWVCLP